MHYMVDCMHAKGNGEDCYRKKSALFFKGGWPAHQPGHAGQRQRAELGMTVCCSYVPACNELHRPASWAG